MIPSECNDNSSLQVYNFMNAKAWPDWWGNKILSANIIYSVFYCSAFVSEFDENATAWISAPIRSPVSTVTGAIAMRQKVENLHFSWVCWPLGADQGITAPRHETDLGGAKLLMGQPWSWAETKTRDMS